MGFLFSSEKPKHPPPKDLEPTPPEEPVQDDETFKTMEMMAKTLRNVGANHEAEEVERQIESLRKSLRRLNDDEPFSTIKPGAGPQTDPTAPAEATPPEEDSALTERS
eukprot:TRINITY_DN19209_c0_g1_i1.p1 TRINITY_DN19209_c0_g1~~TRINITY_DN19209_c0_g1_i1.p1  ORF type:complete len:108 (+),score=25.56 TRINITY_DN19209_c0_g1_i1:74-397(+)